MPSWSRARRAIAIAADHRLGMTIVTWRGRSPFDKLRVTFGLVAVRRGGGEPQIDAELEGEWKTRFDSCFRG
jgi:hypothetical protein